jgi:glycosyl transferase family 25
MYHTYVVHSPALLERKFAIQEQLERVRLSYEWVTEFEPAEISQSVNNQFFVPDSSLSLAQKSCALKHIVAMQRIVERRLPMAFIVEDDAQFRPDFWSYIERIMSEFSRWPRPRILHLGAATNFYPAASKIVKGTHVYEGDRVRNMEFYALGWIEAQRRLDWITQNRLAEPIDIAFNRADPSLGIPFLWSEPPLAEQGSLNGTYQSSLSTKRHSRARAKLQFSYQKLLRSKIRRWLHRK